VPGGARTLNVQITVRTLLLAALVVVLGWAVVTVRDAILLVFIGVFLGLVFETPTRLLVARTPLGRGLAGTIVVLGSTIAVTILAFLLLKPFVESVRDLLKELPALLEELRDKAPASVGNSSGATDVQDASQRLADSIPSAVSAVIGVAGKAFSVGLATFTIIFTALFFISDGPRLRSALQSIVPSSETDRIGDLWERVTIVISRWAIGALTIALIAGTVQGTTAWLLGSSYALALGLVAGFLDLIPNIGATIAGFVLCLALLAEEGVTAAVIMLVVVLVYQQVENNLLTPTIQGKATSISGFFVISGVTLFGALLGVVGALVAVPVTASLQIVVGEYTKDRRERIAAERAALAAARDTNTPAAA
jgi:predicted PurR-regulated permease PerM